MINSNIQSIKQRFGIIGRSTALEHALATAIRVAATDLTVLISGESGVGKEVFSKIIHGLSSRKHNNFIAINCGAIPEGTINSELFGHEKGSFTGATSERKGYFETVNEGTIFLDEIGEMPLDTQAFLLRVLESGEFIRVGSSKILKTDVRVIAASNIGLEKLVKNGKFREDLYYRLSTVPIHVPALRQRREDIYMLFRKFASDFGEKYRMATIRLSEDAQILLEDYPWPGNIRELKNIVENISVLSEERNIDAETLIKMMPNIRNRNLPVIGKNHLKEDLQEREILYKLLFEMKHDLNDLKSLVFEMIRSNNLSVPDIQGFRRLEAGSTPPSTKEEDYYQQDKPFYEAQKETFPTDTAAPYRPIIIDKERQSEIYNKSEVVEENLSIEDNEKDLIKKALKKHKNRRKDAAIELGISERTLYRKIKYYGV